MMSTSPFDWLRRRLVDESFSEARSLTSAFLLVWLTRMLALDERQIVSRSMQPTLAIGDRILVDKASITFAKLLGRPKGADLRINDIVVFTPPETCRNLFAKLQGEEQPNVGRTAHIVPWKRKGSRQNERTPLNPSMDFTKRVVAVAGDQVVVRRGLLYVNKKPARSFPSVSYFGWSSRRCATNSQALTDERHSRTPASYTWGPTIVPKGHVIVLGDYRDASFDSHIWGPLPVQNVIGYARARIWPMRRVAWFPLNPPP